MLTLLTLAWANPTPSTLAFRGARCAGGLRRSAVGQELRLINVALPSGVPWAVIRPIKPFTGAQQTPGGQGDVSAIGQLYIQHQPRDGVPHRLMSPRTPRDPSHGG